MLVEDLMGLTYYEETLKTRQWDIFYDLHEQMTLARDWGNELLRGQTHPHRSDKQKSIVTK